MLADRGILLAVAVLGLSAVSTVASLEPRWASDFSFSLPYDTAALEPWISNTTNVVHLKLVAGATASLHAQSAAITKKLNESSVDFVAINAAASSLTAVSGAIQTHIIYFNSLAPTSQGGGDVSLASKEFASQVDKDFGDFEHLLIALNAETLLVPASGWGWLAWDTTVESLIVTFTNNKELLDSTLLPLLNIDIFEHAFILDVKSNKTQYLENLEHIYNWEGVSKAFAAAVKNEPYYFATADDAAKHSKVHAVSDDLAADASDDTKDSPKKSSHTALIAGVVTSGVAILAALAAGAFFLSKRRKAAKVARLVDSDAHRDSEKLLSGAARVVAMPHDDLGRNGQYVDTSVSRPYDPVYAAPYVLPARECR